MEKIIQQALILRGLKLTVRLVGEMVVGIFQILIQILRLNLIKFIYTVELIL